MTSTAERDPTIQQTLASLDKQALDDYLYDLFRGLDPIETDESGTSTDEANSDDFDMVKDDCSEGTTDDEYGMIAHEKKYTQSPDEKSTQESKKLQDTKVQAELKYLHSQLNRINDEETFLMATSKRTEQYIKNCLEECASMRLDVRCRLKTLDEDRKSIASRFEELCCPDLAERKRKKESATQAPPAEKSFEALKSRSRVKTESNLTATSKIEPSPATVPAVTIRPIKDVDDDSVSSSKASTRPLLEHSGPEMLTRERYTKPYSDEVYDASAKTPFTFDGISSGSGTAPPNPYIPVGFSFLPPSTPQQPCTRQYPSYYPSAGSGWQGPAKANFPPLGTYSCLPPTSLFGSKVPPSPGSPPPYLNYIPPYQPTPGPSPAFYGNASYPQFQWTAPYTQSPWRV